MVGVVQKTNVVNPVKAWLIEFLFIRGLFKGPTGRPLYSYQVTPGEYSKLREILSAYRASAFLPTQNDSWAACFCLFVAESFRREYDASEGGWAWSIFEKRLKCNFSQQQHAELVTKGLEKYWKRPIRQRERGRDLLGSLFAEGGLPWLLVQSESHGFGRAVRKGLKHFYRTEGARRTTTDLMADFEHNLPQTFRTLETRHLMAGIVEQLMYLVGKYPLKDQADPAGYLDKNCQGWRAAFPIPLDEDNARGLINEWLKDAGQRRQERKEEEDKARAFTCKHRLLGELPNWRIRTELILPQKIILPLDASQLSSTRLELGFYEGEFLLAKGGAVYGQLAEGCLSVRFPNTEISLERCELREPVSLRLLENGHPVHVFHFEHSALEYEELPLVFEPRGDEWWFIGSASCALVGSCARIRLPVGFEQLVGSYVALASEADGARWVETSEGLRIGKGAELFAIELNQKDDAALKLGLHGTFAQYDSLPTTVFMGWPRLLLSDGPPAKQDTLVHYANGRPISSLSAHERVGLVRYSVKNAQGETLLLRRFGILPEGFEVLLYPASSNMPAQLVVRNGQGLHLQVTSSSLITRATETEQGGVIYLEPRSNEVPAIFTLEISSRAGVEPLQLRLPYPYQGARLINADGKPLDKKELILDELLGMRIALSSGLPYGQKFYLQLELVSRVEQRIKRQYVVHVGEVPVMLSLFSYQNDMVQMLGAVNEQDAYIRLTLETEQRLLSMEIRRYNGHLQWEGRRAFAVTSASLIGIKSDVKVAAMLLPDPKQAPISIPEKTTQGVGTGWFETVPAMERKGPWLIYPAKDSPVLFRPELYIPSDGCSATDADDVHSLHHATQLFHPKLFPQVIDEQIAMMASDLGHSGWQYLADLKHHFSHLPLSSFESWRSLSRHPEALAVAVFRLEIDEDFCARIRDELAVIWECIPLPLWAGVYSRFRDWLTCQGFPDVLRERVLNNRKAVLPAVVSGFEFVDNYLETGDASRLQKAPVGLVLPEWYQILRRIHEANRNWPTELGDVLSSWVKKQPLPSRIVSLSQAEFSDAVTYLPIFMAYVTAGKSCLSELPVNQAFLKFAIKMISDFDRNGWYTPVHAMMISYLLASDNEA